MEKKERMLPGDWNRYKALGNTKKKIKKQSGLFLLPENQQGIEEQKERPFLVFYFDDKEVYTQVRKYFEIPSRHRSHPHLDSHKLYRLVKESTRNGTGK